MRETVSQCPCLPTVVVWPACAKCAVLGAGSRPQSLHLEVSQKAYCLNATFVSTWFESGWCVGRWNKVAGKFSFVTEEESKDMVAHLEVDPIDASRVVVGLMQFCATAEQHGKPERDGSLVEALSARAQPQ